MRSIIREFVPSNLLTKVFSNSEINNHNEIKYNNNYESDKKYRLNLDDMTENINQKEYDYLKYDDIDNILNFKSNDIDLNGRINEYNINNSRKLTSMRNKTNEASNYQGKVNKNENNYINEKSYHHEKKESFNYNYNNQNNHNSSNPVDSIQRKEDIISDYLLKSQNELKQEKQSKSSRIDQTIVKEQNQIQSNDTSKETIFDNHDKLKFSDTASSEESIKSTNTNNSLNKSQSHSKPMYLFYRTPSNKDGKKNISFELSK